MNNTYWELHITFNDKFHKGAALQHFIETDIMWKFSQIDGDIILGDGVKYYATKHLSGKHSYHDAVALMQGIVSYIQLLGWKPVRSKIEQVLLDERHKYEEPTIVEEVVPTPQTLPREDIPF